MSLKDLAAARRSIRRFTETRVSREDLLDMVRAAAGGPSAGNNQPWQFIVVEDAQTVRRINKNLGWMGGAPEDAVQPRAHIVIALANPEKSWTIYADGGAAAAVICLAAAEKGIGSCWVGSANRDDVRSLLQIPVELEVFSVIALGYPAEEPARVEVARLAKSSVQRDASGRLTVQKLALDAICHIGRYGQRLS